MPPVSGIWRLLTGAFEFVDWKKKFPGRGRGARFFRHQIIPALGALLLSAFLDDWATAERVIIAGIFFVCTLVGVRVSCGGEKTPDGE